MDFILAIVLLLLALAGMMIRKTYIYVPAHELKRQAARRDPLAAAIYPAVAYGNELRTLLWLYVGITAAASLVLLARSLPLLLSIILVGVILWVTFSLIPATRPTRLGARLTMFVTPAVVWLLRHLQPVLSGGTRQVEHRYAAAHHTRLFEREDLLALIEQQQQQDDNRLSAEELEIAKRALQFGDIKVKQVLTPRKLVKTVFVDDTLGPVLIDELHKTGQDFALVASAEKGPLVGTLTVGHLGLSSSGRVGDVMQKTVYYLHEDDSLSEALHAFFTTNCPLFVVVNSRENYRGVVSVENILRELLGHMPGDEFDQYADLAAVAARHSKTAETTGSSTASEP